MPRNAAAFFVSVAFSLACTGSTGLVAPSEPADPKPVPQAIGPSAEIGSSAAVWAKAAAGRLGVAHELGLGDGTTVSAIPEGVDVTDGQLAMNGHVGDNLKSRFILKGTAADLRGWVVLRDRDQAFQYTTRADGTLLVTPVPVEAIYPVCKQSPKGITPVTTTGDYVSREAKMKATVTWRASEPHIGDYPGTDVTKLQSLPGAKKVLYLNITAVMNGTTPKDFSKAEMWKAWQSVAAGYSAFQVNVTTDASVYKAAGVQNSGIANFTSSDDRAFCGMDVFGTSEGCEIFTGPGAEPEQGYGVGRTCFHELGHGLGLSHDGDASNEYFEGLSAFAWYPIMGNYYVAGSNPEALYQFSKGEYAGANNKEDDLALVGRYLPYRDDDIPTTKALTVTGGTVSSNVNRGQIGRNSDTDTFTFDITQSGGHATLTVSRIEYIGGAMLDVDLSLQDSSGKVIASNNPKAARAAKVDVDLAVGSYQLVIKGGAEGTPSAGFSNYSSMGFYGIDGKLTGAPDSTNTGTGGSGGSGGAGGAGGSSAGGTSGSGGVSSTGGASAAGGIVGAGGSAAGGSTGQSDAATDARLTDARLTDSGSDVRADATSTGGSAGAGGSTGSGGGTAGSSGAGGATDSGGKTGSGGSGGGATSTGGSSAANPGAGGVRASGGSSAGGSGSGGSSSGTVKNAPASSGCSCTVGRPEQSDATMILSALFFAAIVAARRKARKS